jgi:predicted nucleic-acid-binding Zn-ribbon protein
MEKGDFCAVVNTAKAFATGFSVSDVTVGTLFTATFKVLAAKGEYAVDVKFDTVGGATSNAAGEDVAMTVAAGTVTVACNHAWDAGVVTTEPGCETEGVKTFTCSKCGETKTEAIKATGHDWNWVIDKEATETEDGVKHEECSKCGAKRNEGTKIDKTGNLDDVPETGDVTYVVMLGAFAMLAAAAFVFAIARRKAVK